MTAHPTTAQPTIAQPNFILLYVDSPKASGDFYTSLLGREPVETSPTFVMFALGGGLMLGLWSRHTVKPAPVATGGGSEIGIAVDNPAAVDATCAAWKSARREHHSRADRDGFRPDICRARSRWPSRARLRAGAG
jgi:catechol 2,3-dioxygenase-like lactoylglutathione lyase family enzyme